MVASRPVRRQGEGAKRATWGKRLLRTNPRKILGVHPDHYRGVDAGVPTEGRQAGALQGDRRWEHKADEPAAHVIPSGTSITVRVVAPLHVRDINDRHTRVKITFVDTAGHIWHIWHRQGARPPQQFAGASPRSLAGLSVTNSSTTRGGRQL